MSPEDFVSEATHRQCRGTSISFNEPTLSLEWSLEVFQLARQRGLYNTFVSNGYMTPEALRLLAEAGLDAMNVDIKGDAQAVEQYCGIDVEVVWRNCVLAAQSGTWLEITTLVIPGVNDSDRVLGGIAGRIVAGLGPDVPWHVSRFYPQYHMADKNPTPVSTLERAYDIGKEAGLRYIYVGNLPGAKAESTFCCSCGTMLIERHGYRILNNNITDDKCPKCGAEIAGRQLS